MSKRTDFLADFQEFKDLWKSDDFTFLARPHQDLRTHIVGMLQEMAIYFRVLIPLPKIIAPAIQLGTIITIIAHDFGKVLPHFQYKVWIKRTLSGRRYAQLPEVLEKLSYHSLASACFAECLCTVIEKDAGFGTVWEDYPLKYAIVHAIIGHHSPQMVSDIGEKMSVFKEPYIQGGNSVWNEIANYFQEIPTQKIQRLFGAITHSLDILNNGPFRGKWFDFLRKSYEKFLEKYTQGDDDIFEPRTPHNQLQKLCTVESVKTTQNDPPRVFFFTTYLASILCDLDIWDARFFHPGSDLHGIAESSNSREIGQIQKIAFFSSLDPFPQDLIRNYVSGKFGNSTNELPGQKKSDGEILISTLRKALFKEIDNCEVEPYCIYTMSSPTGAGKTLALLNAAIKIAQKYLTPPKIIYCLPFVSIGTQVAQQILDLSGEDGDIAYDERFVIDNYLTENCWRFNADENEVVEGSDAKWLISSWQSQIIVSTFVKLFYTLLKPVKAHYLKLHRLANSILILDEIQCLPIKYWELVRISLNELITRFNCTVILSTATQPTIFPPDKVKELAPTHLRTTIQVNGEEISLSKTIHRYNIYYYPDRISLSIFLVKIIEYLRLNPQQDTLIVLNTRKAAIDALKSLKKSQLENTKIYLLSTLVLPLDRKETIEKIKQSFKDQQARKRILVISTQVIEAGVDISFQVVFRDFAPLDSIVQVAGRCNRNYDSDDPGCVFIFQLYDPKKENHLYFDYIYRDLTHVATTTDEFLQKSNIRIAVAEFGDAYVTSEPQIRQEFADYFIALKLRNRANHLLDSFNRLDFAYLASKFSLIERLAGEVPLLFLKSSQAMDIHRMVQQKGFLPNAFYLYSIMIPKQEALSLRNLGVLKEGPCKNDAEILYYTIDEINIPAYYQPESGFITRDQDSDLDSVP